MSILAQYHIGRSEVFLFIAKKESKDSKLFRVKIGSLYDEISEFFEDLLQNKPIQKIGATLASIIKPLVKESQENETIWIVPNKILQHLPFQALPVNDSFLGLRNPICYTPSASTMIFCRNGPRFSQIKVLALGDPTEDLKYARLEAQLAVSSFGGDSLLGREANQGKFFSLTNQQKAYDIIHFACHGFSGTENDYSAGVLLANEGVGTPGEKGELLTDEEIVRRRINAGLVIISACDAGLINLKPSDEVFGMMRSFLHSGASSILVSSWPIDDLATYLFFKSFYRSLSDMYKAGKGNKALAVQDAGKFLFNITLKEVIKFCDEEAENCVQTGDTLAMIDFKLDAAYFSLEANDLQECLKRFKMIFAELKDMRGDFKNLISRIQEEVEEIEFKLLLKQEAIIYSQTPFSNPWYWATFGLYGDWAF